MAQILFVNGCVREGSRTLELANHLLHHLDGDVKEIRLADESLLPLNRERLARRDRALESGDLSDEILKYAAEFASADEIVVAAPFWDLSVPALVKIYFENVTVCGVTFRYNEQGIPQGLCKAKKMHLVMTSGGPMIPAFGIDYLKALAQGFYGIEHVYTYTAEGLDIVGNDPAAILEQAKKCIG